MHCYPSLRYFDDKGMADYAMLYRQQWALIAPYINPNHRAYERMILRHHLHTYGMVSMWYQRAKLRESVEKEVGINLAAAALHVLDPTSTDCNDFEKLRKALGHTMLHEWDPPLAQKVCGMKATAQGMPLDADNFTKLYAEQYALTNVYKLEQVCVETYGYGPAYEFRYIIGSVNTQDNARSLPDTQLPESAYLSQFATSPPNSPAHLH